jgi:hypothetical protein
MPIKIWGSYKSGPIEVLDEADTQEEAQNMAGEYRMAFGAGWTIWTGAKNGKTTEDDSVRLRLVRGV